MTKNERLLVDALRDILLSCRKYAPTIDRSRGESVLRRLGVPLDKPNLNALNGLGFAIGETHNNMKTNTFTSSTEIMRAYSTLIVEAEQDFSPEDFEPKADDEVAGDPELPANDFDDQEVVPDAEPDMNDEFTGDPVSELAHTLSTNSNPNEESIKQAIGQFLKDKNYELVPTHGLENSSGNV